MGLDDPQKPGVVRSERAEKGVGLRVKAHPGLCNGCGNCKRWAPDVYSLDEDGYIDLHLLEVPAELEDQARLGAQVCPEGAITLIEPTLITQTRAGNSAGAPNQTGVSL